MKILVLMLLCLLLLSTFPAPADGSRTSLQPASTSNQQEVMRESIRHGKKRKNKNAVGRGKKKRKLKNTTARRFVEKQFLVHNRTLALLGDDVQKILLNSRPLGGKLPSYQHQPEGNLTASGQSGSETTRLKLLNPAVGIGLKVGQERRKAEGDAPSLLPANDSPKEEAGQVNFASALARLISGLANLPVTPPNSLSPCDKWLDCRKSLEEIFLGPLPSCPCSYPSEIFYEDKLWDDEQQRYYRWRDASGESERLDIYKAGAEYCIRSLLADGSTSLAAQHCCYDRERNLITRGAGAGNPNYISPDVSQRLHEKIDLLPWKLCKGDFTRYNKIRPPNNGNHCTENPKDDVYEKQVRLAKFF